MLAVALALAAALVQTAPAQTGGVTAPAAPTQATAGETPSVAGTAPTPPTAEPEKPRMICRNEQVTGTRFPIRRCHSAVQTEAERAESQEMLRRMQGARTPPVG